MNSILILFIFSINKLVWNIFEINLTSFLEADMIVLIFSFGYIIIRLIGIIVPLINYYFLIIFGISP